jgi:hypothetical protein
MYQPIKRRSNYQIEGLPLGFIQLLYLHVFSNMLNALKRLEDVSNRWKRVVLVGSFILLTQFFS